MILSHRFVRPALLLGALIAAGGTLAAWKYASLESADAAAASQPEPMESVTVAVAKTDPMCRPTTSIGTVLALRSITLRNELPGTVRQVRARRPARSSRRAPCSSRSTSRSKRPS